MQPDTTATTETAPEPSFGTLPGIVSVNSVYADYNCCEEDGQHHRKHKGESLNGVEGWERIEGSTATDFWVDEAVNWSPEVGQ